MKKSIKNNFIHSIIYSNNNKFTSYMGFNSRKQTK